MLYDRSRAAAKHRRHISQPLDTSGRDPKLEREYRAFMAMYVSFKRFRCAYDIWRADELARVQAKAGEAWRHQPRVPAGDEDGGQWTSGGGVNSSAGQDRSDRPSPRTPSSLDPGGGRLADRSDPDVTGSIRPAPVSSSPSNELLTEAARRSGRNPFASVLRGAERAGAQAVEAAIAFYGWLSSNNTEEQRAVIGFKARGLTGSRAGLDVESVRSLNRDEVGKACPALPKLQQALDDVIDDVKKKRPGLSPQQFGTAVHKAMEGKVKALRSDGYDVYAEMSLNYME